ncbi:MAG TPA: DMT family transporter, partial [Gammaproteobacteria bacterium]|nr:DMT family transporter [Gammaproteobacteria bacterium]
MASESLRHSHWSAYAGLTLTALFWAGNAVVARGMVGQIPPVTLAFWRWVVALAIIAPFGVPRIRREWGTLRAHWRSLVVMAALSVGAFNTLLYLAAQSTTA